MKFQKVKKLKIINMREKWLEIKREKGLEKKLKFASTSQKKMQLKNQLQVVVFKLHFHMN